MRAFVSIVSFSVLVTLVNCLPKRVAPGFGVGAECKKSGFPHCKSELVCYFAYDNKSDFGECRPALKEGDICGGTEQLAPVCGDGLTCYRPPIMIMPIAVPPPPPKPRCIKSSNK